MWGQYELVTNVGEGLDQQLSSNTGQVCLVTGDR